VTVDATEISVDIGLSDIPNLLTYNSNNLSDHHLEYERRIAFDVDGNGHLSNDIVLAISHYKPTGGVEMQDALLNFTQKAVWLVNSRGNGAGLIGMATATQNLSEEKEVELSSHQGSCGGRRLTEDRPRFGRVF
jgi:hypothetical protein